MLRWLFLLSFIPRLAYSIYRLNHLSLTGDEIDYTGLAERLLSTFTFSYATGPCTFRPPLYPVLIALCGGRLGALVIIQAVIGSVTVVFTYLIALHYFDKKVAVISAVLLVLSPMSIAACSFALSETLLTFLVVFAVYLWARGNLKLSGVVFGLATLTKPILLPLVVVLLLISAFRRDLLWIAIAAILTIAPWTVRNAIVAHRFIPVATAGYGSTLYYGTIRLPIFGGNQWAVKGTDQYGGDDFYKTFPTLDDHESFMKERAIERIKESPLAWLLARLTQYPRLFIYHLDDWLPSNDVSILNLASPIGWVKALAVAVTLSILILAVIGGWRKRDKWPLLTIPLYFAIALAPFWAEARYTLPMWPMMLIMAISATVQFPPPRRQSVPQVAE